MAFNFNWSPLTADASFYTRAQELLTTALNKSPKPPIIVDDILVNELNLGSIPPDLEILEVGDLAEDRFRGIFKMCYTGDAFLTLKTRVQANPLNTYLSTKPSFASPQPLAAASSLTIPLQITLSEIKLSAIIILVFSKQKGLTLVFRNDPLESLKVSSTFDFIPFVREYLQNEIEGQLRTLLMDDVPAIIHRLSLRLWVPEYGEKEDRERIRQSDTSVTPEKAIDPLASPPEDAVDSMGNTINSSRLASLSLDSGSDTHSLFSQKNLLHLAALTDSHRTLSLFTPSIRDTVFRAWAGPTERGEGLSGHSVMPAMSRTHSHTGSTSTTYVFSDSADPGARPTLSRFSSATTGLNLAATRQAKPHAGRKRKHRVVNLRKKAIGADDLESVSAGSTYTGTTSSAASDSGFPIPAPEEELITPPNSPPRADRLKQSKSNVDEKLTRSQTITPGRFRREEISNVTFSPPERVSTKAPLPPLESKPEPPIRPSLQPPRHSHYNVQVPSEKAPLNPSPSNCAPPSNTLGCSYPYLESSSGGILEQAWMMKIAGEVARRVQEGKNADRGFWDRNDRDDTPPPAYGP